MKKNNNKKKRSWSELSRDIFIPLIPPAVVASIVAPIAIVFNNKGGEVTTDTKVTLINDKPVLSKYTWQGNVEFKFDETTLPTFWPGKGKRTAFVEIKTITEDTEVLLDTNEVEIGEQGYVSVPVGLNKVPNSAVGTTYDCHIQITLMFRDNNKKLSQKTFDVYPSCYIASEEDKAKVITESSLQILTEETTGTPTVTGIIAGTDLSKITTITIPANCSVAGLKLLGSNGDLPEQIKTLVITAPTKSINKDGLTSWYKLKNGALVGTSIDTIVFDDYKTKNMFGFEDYAIDDDYDETTETGSHTNIKNIDISAWTLSTIKNIDKYAGGYLGQPFFDMTDANFTWPEGCKDLVEFKSGVYRIFNVGGINDTLLAKVGLNPTITTEDHFQFASFGEGNKIIIGTDCQRAWTDSRVYIPAGTTDILPFAFQEYINGAYKSSFPECVQIIDFSKVSTINTIGFSAFQDSTFAMVENFPQVTGGCAMCLYYQGNGIVLNPVNTHLKYITVAEGVTSVPAYAFAMLEHVTTVNLPDSVTNIGEGAFYCTGYGLYNTYNVQTPLVPFTINWPSNLASIDAYAFYGANIGYIKFPKTLESIGDYAFAGWDKEEGYVDYYADTLWCLDFSEFDNITQIPTGWKSQNIFKYHWNTRSPKNIFTNADAGDTTNLTNWLLTNGALNGSSGTYYSEYLIYDSLKTLTNDDLNWDETTTPGEVILTGVKSEIAESDVLRKTYYKLEVPATYNDKPVTKIGSSAFHGVTVPVYSVVLDNATNLKEIGNDAFYEQESLIGEINFPASIQNVGSLAFGNTNIEIVRLNASEDGCTYNQSFVIQNGTNGSLARVELADNSKMGNITLSDYCFGGNNAMQYVELSPKITTIGYGAFNECCNLWYIDLHDFKNDDEIPSGWASAEQSHVFDYAFAYLRGYHTPYDETNLSSSTPLYGTLALNKNCEDFKTKFIEFVKKGQFRDMWDGQEYNEGALVEIENSFIPCYE